MNFDLKSVIASIAPTLATMLGGPLAGVAVTALEGAFGLKPGAGTDGITQVLQTGAMTPDTIAAVRAADQKHAEIMAQQGIDVQKLNAAHDEAVTKAFVDDRSSARSMQVAVKSVIPAVFGSAIIMGTLCAAGAILTGHVAMGDTTTATMVGTVIGYLFGEAKAVLAFYFGDTQGSARKTELLAQSTPNDNQP